MSTPIDRAKGQRDFAVQTVLSVVLGGSAFLTFCFLRPRWSELYQARKQQRKTASRLPDLPNSMFGWIPVVYRIPEDEVLTSAGLDAYVFLRFFDFAIKFCAVAFFFALVVILPIHYNFADNWGLPKNHTQTGYGDTYDCTLQTAFYDDLGSFSRGKEPKEKPVKAYLWMYVAFVYIFSGLAIYLLIMETKKIIRIRQGLLGSQTSVTDRTIRLSGIPSELRSEENIKEFIEDLEIGKVDSVMLCRDWGDLDDLVARRMTCLRRLEESWTIHLGYRKNEDVLLPTTELIDENDERSRLLSDYDDPVHVSSISKERPTKRIRFGFLKLQSRKVDAIDYYQEQLRRLDERIKNARKKEYIPTPLAFVTMDSTAACQMAVQAILSPTPMQLLANRAPAPADIVWSNTYLPRANRMARAWMITTIIGLLTVVWTFVLVPLAGLLNEDAINKVSPGFVDLLERHPIGKSLVQTGLPTLSVSLLTVAVPYLYDWLANQQGMTSQGDVELSVISKNFFFTFFNLFVVLTVFGTVSNFYGLIDDINKSLRDTSKIIYTLARSLESFSSFYVNLIILQALGLYPFRLLEFGSVFLHPFYLMSSKTPRDYSELNQPPVFSYGFYLPTTILIFIVCIVYSVLPSSWLVLGFGLIYFAIGSFVHKYQLLYAMDHRQHSTGRAWPMICNRVIVGLLVFQLAMIGILSLRTAFTRAVLLAPIFLGTFWFGFFFRRTYQPLMKFIALRSIDRDDIDLPTPPISRYDFDTDHGRVVDETDETGLRYINPSIVSPLEEAWIPGGHRLMNGVHRD